MLYLVNGTDGLVHGLRRAVVVVNKTDGCRILARAEHYFIKGLRNGDTTTALATNGLMTIATEHGTTHNIDTVVTLSPCTAEHFQIVPVAPVQFAVLRTDIGHEERFLLCPLAPFVITRRTHVTTRIARLHVVEGGDGIADLLVRMESHTLTLEGA